jgi:hypothetical protein
VRTKAGVWSAAVLPLSAAAVGLLLLAGCPSEDLTPPVVAITSPAEGDSIAGATTIRANATDNRAVARVEFFVDAVRVGVDTVAAGSIFECAWTPTGLLPGTSHALHCVAIDEAGNRNTSADVNVAIGSQVGTHHSGTIATDETWTLEGSPHIVDAFLTVDALLTVEPGVVVAVADGATIAVGVRSSAGIAAAGRADSVITFTSLNPSPGPGAWGGIEFRANATEQASVFRHCVVEYGGGAGALVRCEAGRVAIDSCELRASSSRGVWATGSGLGSLSQTAVTECAGYPVSLVPGLVSALGTNNTLADNQRDAVELAGGTVTASDTWPYPGVPYCITGTVTVAGSTNPLLTVAPGCSLLFGDSAALRIGVGQPGGLRADGTYGRIVFAPLSGTPGPGQWRGIQFWEETDQYLTLLNYCRVEGAGAGNTAAITCYSAPVTITSTRVADNAGNGVFCQNAGFKRFENDTITGCAGFPLHIAAQYVSTIGNGNSFSGNTIDAIEVTGGAITSNAQYRRQDVPYLVRRTIEVGSAIEPRLILETGVELQFDSGAALAIGRTAKASLQADSATLTGTRAQPGAWNGLELHRYALSTSRVEHCRLLYGGGAIPSHGILYIDSCLPTITNNEIAYSSSWCIYLVERDTYLEPDTLRYYNSLHDWAPGDTDINVGNRRR